jgi:SAM-dependent methyltransferase
MTSSSEKERRLVHATYDKIAEHFSETRYSVWPNVSKFLQAVESCSLILDNGCGNGKNCNRGDCIFIGTDTCRRFLEISGEKPEIIDTIAMNSKMLSFRDDSFDYVLSIAVIHHIYLESDRVKAIREIARVLRTGGKALISVWSKHKHYDYGDNIIPWNNQKKGEIVDRYYHLFKKDDIVSLVNKISGIKIIDVSECYNNYFITIQKL